MKELLIVIFTMTLTYLAVAGRLSTYVRILILQGLLLFGVAFLELKHINVTNLIFILLETLIFKAILIPFLINRIIQRNSIKHETAPNQHNFYAILIIMVIIISSFILAYALHDEHLKINYFTSSVSAIFGGLFLIIFRKKIITHIVGYVVLENGIFLLSLALGSEMPMIVNIGILLDLFTSVLVLGIFANKISTTFKSTEIDTLIKLKD